MSAWEAQRRLDFIDDMLVLFGRVNRSDLTCYFGISEPQTSVDFREFAKLDPNFHYDRRKKCYERRNDGGSVRNSTTGRIEAWRAFGRL